MTKEELLPLAKTYFDSDKERKEIFGTEDRHFYNTEGDARAYCKGEVKYFHYTRQELEQAELAEVEAEIKKEEAAAKEVKPEEVKPVEVKKAPVKKKSK